MSNQTSQHTIGAFAPGKLLLSGEHSVVHGFPAVAMATTIGTHARVVPRNDVLVRYKVEQLPVELSEFIRILKKVFQVECGLTATQLDAVELILETELPIQSGMGSSASLAAAGFSALAAHFQLPIDNERLFQLTLQSERYAHGNPSGVDPTVVVYKGVLRFQKVDGQYRHRQLVLGHDAIPPFVLINSGRPAETTKEMVKYVGQQYAESDTYRKTLREMGDVTEQISTALEQGELAQLLALIEQNQLLLDRIGVVSDSTRELVQALRELGVVVKVTGAGGRQTGSGMLLVFYAQPEHPERLRQFCAEHALQYLETEVMYGGTE